MSDQELIERLARRRREQRAEAEALERAAAQDPALRADAEAHRPLEEEARERILARLLQRPSGEEPPAPTPGPAPISREPRKERLLRAWMIAPLVFAAALVLVVVLPRAWEPRRTLPPFALEIGGEALVRGGGPQPPRVGPGSTLQLVLRPAQPIDGGAGARAVLVRDGQVAALQGEWEAAPSGSMRLRARVEAAPGGWTLLVAVGRPELLPRTDADLAAAWRQAQARDYQVLSAPVELVER